MIDLVSKASIDLLGYDAWSPRGLLELWLRHDLASTHTDLICISREEDPELWLFSPFQTRPLGKELPSILMTCSCSSLDKPGSRRTGNSQTRTIWKVTHNSKHGKALRDIAVKAACSTCKQTWILPTADLVGKLHHTAGLYAAIVPYFPK
jgi:hypothetical protein